MPPPAPLGPLPALLLHRSQVSTDGARLLGLPRIALVNLFSYLAFPFTSSIRVLDIRVCIFDLAPIASCRDLRHLFIFKEEEEEEEEELDLSPLQGLMPRLKINECKLRGKGYPDARNL
jgi:hypothetical protein